MASGQCTTCDTYHYLGATFSCELCVTNLTGCLTCNNAGTECSSCVDNTFYYDGAVSCVPCTTGRGMCITCSSAAVCLSCQPTYYVNGGVC